jgi:hypothetical protein
MQFRNPDEELPARGHAPAPNGSHREPALEPAGRPGLLWLVLGRS